MSITTTTHLNFTGTARQALERYQEVFGGELALTTYGDVGVPEGVPGADHVVFGQLETAGGFRLMAYDIPGHTTPDPARTAGTTRRENGATLTDRPFFQSLRGGSLEEITPLWDALVDGGTVVEPLAASPWSAGFGMVTDRFGVTWVVDVQAG
jgi:PhnB protein